MPLDDDIYQDRILEHFESPYHRGSCPAPTHAHEDDNPLCGDRVRLELSVDSDGTIRDAYFQGEGCCISQASASMLIEAIEGRRVDELKSFSAQQMLELFGPRLTPNRQKCCLLSWRVLQEALYSALHQSEVPNTASTLNQDASALSSRAAGASGFEPPSSSVANSKRCS